MPDRDALRREFLTAAGWSKATFANLAGDASNRRYFRMTLAGTPAVLMDAPPEKGEDVRLFIKIAQALRSAALSAPEVMAEDREHGFLLLEDLGDDLFARVLTRDPGKEEELYKTATDVLIRLHDATIRTSLSPYTAAIMSNLAGLAFDWYATGAIGQNFSHSRADFVNGFQEALGTLDDLEDVLIQRDYHAENLLWLPDRNGAARVGLLDFQDAMTGHRSYDLVSLLQDARRDVTPDIESQMIDYYIAATQVDPTAFKRAYAMMGLQRNLRIIGVFARLCIRDSKPYYIDLIPRVWDHLVRDLEAVNLGDITAILKQTLPEPEAGVLKVLKTKCGTIPHPS